MNEDGIKVHIDDCWQHLRDIWTGAVVKNLCSQLSEDLKDDFDDFHFILQVQMEVSQIHRAVEKEFAKTAQYAKGDDTMFYGWKKTHHPTTYIYPCTRTIGDARQDIGSEGAIPVFMNIPYYLEFLNWRLCCRSDNILMKNLYITLQLVELVALLCVLSIYHFSITIPVRWLAGNTDALADFDFSLADMCTTVGIMDEAFAKIINDCLLFLDEEFIINIFKDLVDKIDPLDEHLRYIFERKQSHA
eukprot:4368142-Ditylum_brightwellii.AAC.1